MAPMASVRGTDVLMGTWSLLFSTPFYQMTMPQHEQVNAQLLKLLEQERSAKAFAAHPTKMSSSAARSLSGNGWRTDDSFLSRRDPAIRKLHKFLLNASHTVVQYGQPTPLNLELHLSGWAISLGRGGRQTEHVHPHASWSGVYYVNAGAAGTGSKGGCLRVVDPRPGAQMVTLGANDNQFMEARTICPSAGLLVMFPSWLSHGVTPLDEDGTSGESRVAVAFNVHGAERGG